MTTETPENPLRIDCATVAGVAAWLVPPAIAPALDMVRFVVAELPQSTLAMLGIDAQLQQALAATQSPSPAVSRAVGRALAKVGGPEPAKSGAPTANAAWLLGVSGMAYDEWIRMVTL